MEVAEIKNHIQKRQFNKFYIFTGPEWKVQRIYLEQMAAASGKDLRYVDSIADIYSKLKNTSFISKPYLYVIRDDKEIMQNEKLQAQLETLLGQNILVLLLTAPDKRLKFYKTYKDAIVEFGALKPAILKKYIQNEIPLSDKNCDKLMEVCEYDYGRCLLEIYKLKQFIKGNRNDDRDLHATPVERYTDYCFRTLLEGGAIYQPPKDAIFDFVDAILDGKVNLAFDLYQQCLAVGEVTMVMVSVLYNNAKAVLQVQSCHSSDIAKTTGLTNWQITNAKKHLNVFQSGELVRMIKLCQQCQQSIVTGEMDEEYVMEYILTNIF